MAQTAVQELISLIPDAKEIKEYISEVQPDEKMLDEWLWERMFKGRNWIEKEKEQMFDLIRFMRTNDKMGKRVEDLYNEFINQ